MTRIPPYYFQRAFKHALRVLGIFATPKGLEVALKALAAVGNSISIASLGLQMGKIAAFAQKTKLRQLLKNQIR